MQCEGFEIHIYRVLFLAVPTQCKQLFVSVSASVKVLNSGLGPFKDQTAEMVLFWSSFPYYDYIALQPSPRY